MRDLRLILCARGANHVVASSAAAAGFGEWSTFPGWPCMVRDASSADAIGLCHACVLATWL